MCDNLPCKDKREVRDILLHLYGRAEINCNCGACRQIAVDSAYEGIIEIYERRMALFLRLHEKRKCLLGKGTENAT